MSTRNDRLNRQMLRKDDCTLPDDRRHGNSDRGEALEHMLDELDGVPGEHASRAEKELVDEIQLLMWAILLSADNQGHLVPALMLIARNGRDRKTSIAQLRRNLVCSGSAARKCYFRHRCLLDSMFIWTNKDSAFLVM